MQSACQKLKKNGKKIGLVPTMGALHEGHLSLIKKARKENDVVVVSIFVNPKQFGPNEDYLRYPRSFGKDVKLCKKEKVDFVFAPSAVSMYPDEYLTFVNVEQISEILCGKFRPGHFRGVATVVSKFFNITQPEKAYFGMKDFQQLKIIQRMGEDLNFPVKIVPCPVVREKGGLARSSRNTYLSARERFISKRIYESLQLARYLVKSRKIKSSEKLRRVVKNFIKKIPSSRIDYVNVVDAKNLSFHKKINLPVAVAVAVWVGKTRLIDNTIIR